MAQEPPDAGPEDHRRQLNRLGARFLLRAARIVATTLDRDLVTALVALAVARANLAPIDANPDLALRYAAAADVPPDALRRPVSMYAIGKALRMPYETVRRHVRKLIAAGTCQMVEGGVILPSAVIEGADLSRALEENWEALVGVVADAARIGMRGRASVAVSAPDAKRYGLRLTMRFFLDALELSARAVEIETVCVLILRYVGHANIAHLVEDIEFGRQYAGLRDIAPDEMRRPVSVYAVAKALLIPYETVRRHAAKLVERGLLDRLPDGGLIMPQRAISLPEVVKIQAEFADLTQKLLDNLAEIGLPPAPEPEADQAAATSPV